MLAASVTIVACGSSSSASRSDPAPADTSTSATAPAGGTTVELELIAYRPEQLTVDVGTTVTWKQMDPGFHTVTSGKVDQGSAGVTTEPDGTFASGNLATGDTFTYTFDSPGTYSYFCEIHPATMSGEVIVR